MIKTDLESEVLTGAATMVVKRCNNNYPIHKNIRLNRTKKHRHIFVAVVVNILLTGYVPGALVAGFFIVFALALCVMIFLAVAIEIYQRMKGGVKDKSVAPTLGRVFLNLLGVISCVFVVWLSVTVGNVLKNLVQDTIAGDSPRITITTNSGKIRLKIPLTDFWDERYRRDENGVFHLNINQRKISVATKLNHNSVSSRYIEEIDEYESVIAREIYGLKHYKENDQPIYMRYDHFIPVDPMHHFGLHCANTNRGYGHCRRIAMRDFSTEFRYSYRLEPEELKFWLEIEKEVESRIRGYIVN